MHKILKDSQAKLKELMKEKPLTHAAEGTSLLFVRQFVNLLFKRYQVSTRKTAMSSVIWFDVHTKDLVHEDKKVFSR
jgi:hypothetical protein